MPTYKDEKTGLWYCKFVYRDWTGQRKQKKKMGFHLQKEAKAYEIEFLSKMSQSCDMLFSSFVELYLEDCKVRLKPTTYYGKVVIIQEHLIPYFGKMKLNEIEAVNVSRWQTEKQGDQKHYAATYLKTMHNQLSAIFNYACKFYHLKENPARECGSMGRMKANVMKFWTVDEFNKFDRAVSDKNLVPHRIQFLVLVRNTLR